MVRLVLLGIVNAVNPDEDVLYLLTPENSNVLKNVVELAKVCMQSRSLAGGSA